MQDVFERFDGSLKHNVINLFTNDLTPYFHLHQENAGEGHENNGLKTGVARASKSTPSDNND